jgi:PAS domain S-box-containing protein
LDLAVAPPELPAQARLDSALQAGRLGYWELDHGRRLTSSAMHNRNFGRAASDPLTYELFVAAIHPNDRDRCLAVLEAALSEGALIDAEVRVRWPDGALHWLRLGGQRIASEPGWPERIVGISFDITDRKAMEGRLREEIAERQRAEEQQRLLMEELNHRVRNTLAIVLAIANQTLRHASSAERFRSDFEARITALSQAHNLMTDSKWEGTSLRDIVERVLAPYSGPQQPRCEITGDAVRVGPKYAVSLLMAFHELATNAAKYGALSNASGRVAVSWTLSKPPHPPALTIEWRETGGPPVKPRRRRGFGSRLIDGLAAETSGTVTHGFEREGVACTMVLPLPPADGQIIPPTA